MSFNDLVDHPAVLIESVDQVNQVKMQKSVNGKICELNWLAWIEYDRSKCSQVELEPKPSELLVI